MQRALLWMAIGVVVMVGGVLFALRGAAALQFSLASLATILVACALGAAAAGAVIARHAATRPAHEIVISAAAALALILVLADASRGTRSFTEAIVVLSLPALAAVGVVVLAGSALGAHLVRRVPASPPSRPLLLLTGGLLTMGLTMLLLNTASAIYGAGPFSGWFALAILFAVVAGGFLAQAIASVRRPWACGAGDLLLLLVLVQERDGDLLVLVLTVGLLTLVGTLGAWIAGRVFAKRFTAAASALPTARLE